jgi:hypothetical protein
MRTPVADSPTAHRPELSATHVLASTLAAVSGAIAASSLGVAGTIAGAALASGLSTVGTALYDQALRRTRDRLRVAPTRWGRVAMTTVLVFALAMGAITLGELWLGHSAADTVHGGARPSDPTIVQLVKPQRGEAQTRAVHRVSAPKSSATRPASNTLETTSVSPSATPSRAAPTPSPRVTPGGAAPTPSATASPAPSPTPTPTVTPPTPTTHPSTDPTTSVSPPDTPTTAMPTSSPTTPPAGPAASPGRRARFPLPTIGG